MKRIRISFSKKKFKRVKVLAGHNDDLAKLLGSTDELSVLRERRNSSSAPVVPFQKVPGLCVQSSSSTERQMALRLSNTP